MRCSFFIKPKGLMNPTVYWFYFFYIVLIQNIPDLAVNVLCNVCLCLDPSHPRTLERKAWEAF